MQGEEVATSADRERAPRAALANADDAGAVCKCYVCHGSLPGKSAAESPRVSVRGAGGCGSSVAGRFDGRGRRRRPRRIVSEGARASGKAWHKGAPLRAFRPQGAAPGLALDARLVTGVGVIGGFDFRRRDLVDVAIVVVEVRVLGSGGGVDGLVALLVALGLVVGGIRGALLGELRAFLFGERKFGLPAGRARFRKPARSAQPGGP
jgi:hypothetical protein